MNREKTGKLIAQLRREKNLSQAQLAEMIYVSDKAVSRWETGRGFPDIGCLEALALCLDVSEAELIRGERIEESISRQQLRDISSESLALTKDYVNRHTLIGILSGFMLGLIILALVVIHLNSPMYLKYDESLLKIEQLADGRLIAVLDGSLAGCDADMVTNQESGRREMFISCYQTALNGLKKQGSERIVMLGESSAIDDVYYYPGEDFDQLLFSSDGRTNESYSVMTLPRMIYGYWLVIGMVISTVGVISCLLLRKKRFITTLMKMVALPLAFTLAIPLTLAGHFDEVYNALYYFSGILIVALAIWGLLWLLIERYAEARKSRNRETV
ncbi:MAG: helix-turn-helix transcriptional regulator [Erysipelotrichaceae bacterium]|nr:helix-turn-helix transcriptional regulator [Erysipelotrichaceae bacterium]